jgi:hypothetical protein
MFSTVEIISFALPSAWRNRLAPWCDAAAPESWRVIAESPHPAAV